MKIKNLFSFLKSKLGMLYHKNKKLFLFTLVLIVVIVFCFVSYPNNGEKENSKSENNAVTHVASVDYASQLEEKVKQMLLAIEEVKSASVMVVCDSSEKIQYLKNITETSSGSGETSSKTTSQEVVYEKNGSISTPIIVSKTMPKVVGVWIVINSISPSTKLAIINSVCSVLNISESSISILQER